MKIYHNPSCSKSNCALDFLNEKGLEFEVVDYLKNPPSREEFKRLLMRLNVKPIEIIRKNEKLFKEKLNGKNFTDEEWITIMLESPELIERPIVEKGYKAVVARPVDAILEII